MAEVRQQNTKEFGWNGTDGFVRNDGKYSILFNKPQLSFGYSALTYSSDPSATNIVLDTTGQKVDLTPEMVTELTNYIDSTAVLEPWEVTIPSSLLDSVVYVDGVLTFGRFGLPDVVADINPLVNSAVSAHNVSGAAHDDIRKLIPYRVKSEIVKTGSFEMAVGTDYSMFDILDALTNSTSGSLAPLLDVTSKKIKPFNVDHSYYLKFQIIGSWLGSTTNKSFEITIGTATVNKLVRSRDASVSSDSLSFSTFISVDVDGFLVQNGAPVVFRSNGGPFIITEILVVAEQLVHSDSIQV